MTADAFLTADGCRAYVVSLSERTRPSPPDFTLQSRKRRPVHRLTPRERETQRILLRLALLIERAA